MRGYFHSTLAVFLIFVSIIPYASADVWWEAWISALIFLAVGVEFLRPGTKFNLTGLSVLTPILILAGYSFMQGFSSLVINNGQPPLWMPYSFDALGSFRVGVKLLAFCAFMFWLFSHATRRGARGVFWGLIAVGVFFAGWGFTRYFLQLMANSTLLNLPGMNLGVGFGPYINQNHFALLMLMTLGLILAAATDGRLAGNKRFFCLVLAILVWTTLVLTGSRGGILSSLVVVVCLLFRPPVRTDEGYAAEDSARMLPALKKIFAAAVILLVFCAGIFFIGQDRVVRRFEKIPQQVELDSVGNSYKRIQIWSATIEIVEEHWLFGVGFSGFRFAVSEHLEISGEIVPHEAHNDYLEFVASGGIAATALAIWFLFEFSRTLWRRLREPDGSFMQTQRIGALAGMSGVAAHSAVDFGLQIFANLLFFGALLFLALAQSRSYNKRASRLDEDKTYLIES